MRPYEGDAVAAVAGKRVLVVDDNATNRQIARAYLESWGMLVRETASPAEAIEWVRRSVPLDAAVLDMHMPELDGLALARELRKSTAALPLILLTSLGRREDDSDLFAAHLTKPIRPSQLYDALVDAARRASARAGYRAGERARRRAARRSAAHPGGRGQRREPAARARPAAASSATAPTSPPTAWRRSRRWSGSATTSS